MADTIGVKNPFRYRGYYYDTDTGLYYLQSRYYDPEIGRFINADALLGANADMLSYNLFAYRSNDPVNCSDPVGCGKIRDAWNWVKGKYDQAKTWVSNTWHAVKNIVVSSTVSNAVDTGISHNIDKVPTSYNKKIVTQSPAPFYQTQVRTYHDVPVQHAKSIKISKGVAKVGVASIVSLGIDIIGNVKRYDGADVWKATAIDVVGLAVSVAIGFLIGSFAFPVAGAFILTTLAGVATSIGVDYLKRKYVD